MGQELVLSFRLQLGPSSNQAQYDNVSIALQPITWSDHLGCKRGHVPGAQGLHVCSVWRMESWQQLWIPPFMVNCLQCFLHNVLHTYLLPRNISSLFRCFVKVSSTIWSKYDHWHHYTYKAECSVSLRSPLGSVIHKMDSRDWENLVRSKLWFISMKSCRWKITSRNIWKCPGETRHSLHSWSPSGVRQTALSPSSNDAWHGSSIANQGSSHEPLCPELLLGVL